MTQTPANQSDEPTRCSLFTVFALLTLAVLVRGGMLLAMPGGLAEDTDSYRLLAENLLQSGTYTVYDLDNLPGAMPTPSAYRPPLYPLLLTNVARDGRVTPSGIGWLHLGLGVATVWLVYVLARWWTLAICPSYFSKLENSWRATAAGQSGGILPPTPGGRWPPAIFSTRRFNLDRSQSSVAMLAAVLVVCDPILLNQSTRLMTETLATFLAVLALACLTRLSRAATPFNAALAGGALALAMLCRPTFLVWLAVCGLAALALGAKWPRRLANLSTLVIVAAIFIAPWAVRNYHQLGRPIITTTHGGYTLWLGNNRSFYNYLRQSNWGIPWDAIIADNIGFERTILLLERRPLIFSTSPSAHPQNIPTSLSLEIDFDSINYSIAWKNIRREPGMFTYACAVRIGRLWGLVPHQLDPHESLARRLSRYAVGVWYAAEFVLAALGIYALGWRIWRTPWLWGVLLCLSFTAVHMFYWSNLRMRAPLMPVVALLAAVGMAWIVAGKDRRKSLFDSCLSTGN